MLETTGKKKCFVVMGFGEKTDCQQQKTYDLDNYYQPDNEDKNRSLSDQVLTFTSGPNSDFS